MKMFLSSALLIGFLAVSAPAQEYVNTYVLGNSDYSCSYNDSTIKSSLKEHKPDVAAYAAFQEGMCQLDGRKSNGGTRKQNLPKALTYFQKAVGWNGGGGMDTGYIGWRFLGNGSPTVPANREMAEYWLRYSINKYRDPVASYNLGLAYLKGDVLPQDDKQAVELLTQAVKGSNSYAALVLAKLYREGKVVPQNLELANALSVMAPQFAAREMASASAAQERSDNLERELAQIRADSHAAMMNALTTGIANLAVQATTPNAIQVAANQQVSNINATAANVQAAQAEEARKKQQADAQERLNQALARQSAKPAPAPRPATTIAAMEMPKYPAPAAAVVPPGPISSCRDMLYSVHLDSKWTDAKKTEVVGFLSNNSVSDATCTWAFHKNGVWTEMGQATLKAGAQHKGGEGGGIWSMGADSSTIKYSCFEGIDPVDEHGHSCTANVKFTGMTIAGTDR